MAKHYNYRCKFCDSGFVNEDRYEKHNCKQMKRDEEMRSPIGLAALEYFKTWNTALRRASPTAEQFLKSKRYTTFVKFAKFVVNTNLSNPTQYIRYMVRKDVDPVIWANPDIYSNYLRYLDKDANPYEQADQTTKYLEKVADLLECDIGDVFEELSPNDVIVMLQQRKLYPWLLLASKKFMKFVDEASTEQKVMMLSIIKPATWVQRRKNNPKVSEFMKKTVAILKL